jgi:hypothetical protein
MTWHLSLFIGLGLEVSGCGDFKFSTFSSPSLIASAPVWSSSPVIATSQRLDPLQKFASTHPHSSCTLIYTSLQLSPVLVRLFFLFRVPTSSARDSRQNIYSGSPFKNARFPHEAALMISSMPSAAIFRPPCAALQEPRITVHAKVVQLLEHSVLVPSPIRFAYPMAASSISSSSDQQAGVCVLTSY